MSQNKNSYKAKKSYEALEKFVLSMHQRNVEFDLKHIFLTAYRTGFNDGYSLHNIKTVTKGVRGGARK